VDANAPPSAGLIACHRDSDEGNPTIAGWIKGGIAATFRHGPCRFDATSGLWVGLGPRQAARFVTDGSTVAGSVSPGHLVVASPQGEPLDVSLPPWADDWAAWGSRLSAMPGGGYVFDLVPDLAIVSTDGTLSVTALPDGYLVAGSTSDPTVFLLRRDDRQSPQRMTGPYPAVVWRQSDKSPTSLPILVDAVEPATSQDLVWLRDDSSSWSLVDESGRTSAAPRSIPPWTGQPDPTGQYVLEQTDRSQGCEHATPPSCISRLIDRASGRVLAQVGAASNSDLFWNDSSVAFLPTTADPVARPAATDIVILSASGASKLALPPAN
jgi:hypothetical protein